MVSNIRKFENNLMEMDMEYLGNENKHKTSENKHDANTNATIIND